MNKFIQLKDNLGNLLFPKIKRDIMTIHNTSNQVITTNVFTEMQFNNIFCQTGNKLTKVGNAIRIGAGVSKVYINAQAWTDDLGLGYVWGIIKKNGSTMHNCICRVNSQYKPIAMTNKLIPVIEGDLITVAVKFDIANQFNQVSGAGYANSNHLTVEVVE